MIPDLNAPLKDSSEKFSNLGTCHWDSEAIHVSGLMCGSFTTRDDLEKGSDSAACGFNAC